MDFQGFQNQLPGFVLLLLIVLFLGIAILSYRKQNNLPTLSKYVLTGLRFVSLVLVLLLFLNPYFFSSKTVEKNPSIFFLFDNSESVGITKGEYQGLESYQSLIDELSLENRNDIDVDYFLMGQRTNQVSDLDSLNVSASETNFIEAINQLQELEDDYDASVIISDGIITFGRNPVLQAAQLSAPIYTIALGDTNSVRDVTINNVISNPTGYTDSRHSVEVEISQTGFSGSTTSITITNQNGEILAEENVTFRAYEEVRNVEFQIPLEETGLQQFNIEITPIEDEWTEENNFTLFSIDVVDSKTRILHLAFEVHPDVKMVRSILEDDEAIELTPLTWISGSRFIEAYPESDPEFDLIIFHGHPGRNLDLPFVQSLNETPRVYFHLPNSRNRLNPLLQAELINNSGSQIYPISIIPRSGSTDHPIMELPEIVYQNTAEINTSLRTSSNEPDAGILFTSGFQGMETPNPLISVLERGNTRRTDIAAWGWFKMYQSPVEEEREFITQLISNIVDWTSNDPDDRRLKVSPSKSLFNISEEIIINGNLNNESGEPESNANIDILISEENNEERAFSMQNLGSGTYKLELDALSPGRYTYEATARKGDREIDVQTGEFIVENSNAELINTIRNDALLSTIASETGGSFYSYDQVESFWTDLEQAGLLDIKQELVESYQFPVRNIFWFVLLLSLLGAEWLIRKYYAMP